MSAMSTSGPNREQIEFWNGPVADIWVDAQERLDASLQWLTDELVRAAAVQPGERVLDVGCGCGTTTIQLAHRGAHVTGIDVSEPMLERARARARDHDHVDFILADASSFAFAPQYDLLFSRFGVMFFADPVAAFGNLARALRPGGRLCMLCWQGAIQNPWVSIPGRIAQSRLGPPDPVDPRAPGMFAFAEAAHVESILGRAGFRDVVAEPLAGTNRLGADLDEAMDFLSRIGPLRRLLEPLKGRERAEVLEAVRAGLAPYESTGGVELRASCWIFTAHVT